MTSPPAAAAVMRTVCPACERVVGASPHPGGGDRTRLVRGHQPPDDPGGCCRCEGSGTIVLIEECWDHRLVAVEAGAVLTGRLRVVPAAETRR